MNFYPQSPYSPTDFSEIRYRKSSRKAVRKLWASWKSVLFKAFFTDGHKYKFFSIFSRLSSDLAKSGTGDVRKNSWLAPRFVNISAVYPAHCLMAYIILKYFLRYCPIWVKICTRPLQQNAVQRWWVSENWFREAVWRFESKERPVKVRVLGVTECTVHSVNAMPSTADSTEAQLTVTAKTQYVLDLDDTSQDMSDLIQLMTCYLALRRHQTY